MKTVFAYVCATLLMLWLTALPVWAQGGGSLGSEKNQQSGNGYSQGLGRANARLGGQPNAQTQSNQPRAFMGYDQPPQAYPPEYWRAPDATKPGWAHSPGGWFQTSGGWIRMSGSQKQG